MIKSPTYTIVREYEGRLPLYHLMFTASKEMQIQSTLMNFLLVQV